MWMLHYRFFLHKVCDLVRHGQVINHLWQAWVHWNYKLDWAYGHKSCSQIHLGIPHAFIYSGCQQCKSSMGSKYLFFPPLSGYPPYTSASQLCPLSFIPSAWIQIVFSLQESPEILQVIFDKCLKAASFWIFLLYTWPHSMKGGSKWSSPNQQQGVIMAPFTV